MHFFFIAYEFPPLNRIGSHRPYKMVKILSERGHQCDVFTLNPDLYEDIYQRSPLNPHLLESLNDNVKIHFIDSKRIKLDYNNKLQSWFHMFFRPIGLESKGWSDHLFTLLKYKISELKPDYCIISAPPFSVVSDTVPMLNSLGIKVIADMRDAWTYWVYNPFATWFHYYYIKSVERRTFKSSTFVFATSKQTLADFIKLHPDIDQSKFVFLPNGYEVQIKNYDLEYPIRHNDQLVFTYVGSFYYSPESQNTMFLPFYKRSLSQWLHYRPRKENWLYRSPHFIFQAFQLLLNSYPSYKSRIRLKFVGYKEDWLLEMIEKFALDNHVELTGRVSLDDSLRIQSESDFLLLTSAKVENGRDYSVAGKSYEYLQFKKPIVSFVTDGAQKDLLEEWGNAVIIDPDSNLNSQVLILKQLIDNQYHFKVDKDAIDRYWFPNILNQMVTFFNESNA